MRASTWLGGLAVSALALAGAAAWQSDDPRASGKVVGPKGSMNPPEVKPGEVPVPMHPMAVPPPEQPSSVELATRALDEVAKQQKPADDRRRVGFEGVEESMKQTLRGLGKAQQGYAPELSAIVETFPVYSPGKEKWSGSIKVTGSSTMGPLLTNLAIGFESMYGSLDILVRQGGSDLGLADLAAGRCEIAAISRALAPDEIAALEATSRGRAVQVTIALDGVCVFVNADNPLPGITREQCNGVFSIEHTRTKAPIYRWNQVDPGSPLGHEFLTLYIPKDNSGTLRSFRQWCMPGEEFTTSMRYVEPGPSSVVNACCAYPYAIGIAGFGNLQAIQTYGNDILRPRARVVPIADEPAGPFVAPTVDSIRGHSYPLWRPLNLVWVSGTNRPSNPAVVDWMRYILSETGQDQVCTVGFVPPHLDAVPAELGSIDGDNWKR